MPKIKVLKDEIIYDGKFIKTIRRHFIDLSGRRKVWEMVERKTFHRIISVTAITPKKEIVFIKIYRIPLKSYIIEPCMGLTDKKGESEAKTARRELLEETGYRIKGKLMKINIGPHNSGLSASEIVSYIGLNAQKVVDPKLESSEDIEVIKLPFKKAYRYLSHPPKGVKVDIKVFGILYLISKKFGLPT